MNKKGMAGLIFTILVLNLMLLFSLSFSDMVSTEAIIQDSANYSERARDAAYSGTQYIMSFAQTSSAMYTNDPVRAKNRLYFTLYPTNATKITNLFGSIVAAQKPAANSPNLIQSDWIYVNTELEHLDEDENDGTEDEYYFRAVSYPKNNGANAIDPEYYMIKSQGKYREYSGADIVKEYNYQIIAEIKIKTSGTPGFKVNRWKQMEFQSDDALNTHTAY